jgi:hypothetical protein
MMVRGNHDTHAFNDGFVYKSGLRRVLTLTIMFHDGFTICLFISPVTTRVIACIEINEKPTKPNQTKQNKTKPQEDRADRRCCADSDYISRVW